MQARVVLSVLIPKKRERVWQCCTINLPMRACRHGKFGFTGKFHGSFYCPRIFFSLSKKRR